MPRTREGDKVKDHVVELLLKRVKKDQESHAIAFSSPLITMAPRTLRDLNPSSFDPRVVSIGPLHRKDEKLQPFEVQKVNYLNRLMHRTVEITQKEILELCAQKVYASMEQIKACYLTMTYGDAEIVDMMIMDACFILEFLFKCKEIELHQNMEGVLFYQNVLYDLVLLENQIPFFILEIFKCTLLNCYPINLFYELMYLLIEKVNVFAAKKAIDDISFDKTHNILSLIHQCYYKPPVDNKPPVYITKDGLPPTIPSVTDLDRAGVSFEPNGNAKWLMGMEVKLYRLQCFFQFWSKPILKMPVLKVDDNTDMVLRNLIAYEQLGSDDTYVTSYAFALDTLVDTQADVAKLVDSKVLLNFLGSDEEVANFINSICKDAVLGDFFYKAQWETLNDHYEGYWTKNIAKLKRNYFGSPWSMIALLAGIILFVLTVVQTIFTVNPP